MKFEMSSLTQRPHLPNSFALVGAMFDKVTKNTPVRKMNTMYFSIFFLSIKAQTKGLLTLLPSKLWRKLTITGYQRANKDVF